MKLIEFGARYFDLSGKKDEKRKKLTACMVQATGKSQEFMDGCKSTVITLKCVLSGPAQGGTFLGKANSGGVLKRDVHI